MKILIVNPPFYRLQRSSLVHYPPGCCYMAAVLEKAGFASHIYNADYDPRKNTILGNTNHINVRALTELSDEYEQRLANDADPIWQEVTAYLKSTNPDVLIISIFNTTLTAGIKIAQKAKIINSSVKIVFEASTNRGLHCALDPAVSVDPKNMDFALRKEPEETIVELVRALTENATDFSSIQGLSWKNNQGILIHNPDRPPLQNLDLLPFPARHLLDGHEKMPPHTFQGIYGSRGCPFDCIFCGCHTSWGYMPRLRSAKNMVDEIAFVHKRFRTTYFYICDDIFFIQKDRAREFCELILEKKLPVYWSAQTRAEMADEKTLRLMKQAGGQHIAVGVEVGNPHVRELIRKGNTVDDVRRCARLIKKTGLHMVAFCMIGLPWEGEEEIQDTVRLIKEIDPYIVYPYMPTPASGTELAKILTEKNPIGFAQYRDRCHINTSATLAERLSPELKKKVIEKALMEFVKINRKNLLFDLMRRPQFYIALAHDMRFFTHPKFLFYYFRDYCKPS